MPGPRNVKKKKTKGSKGSKNHSKSDAPSASCDSSFTSTTTDDSQSSPAQTPPPLQVHSLSLSKEPIDEWDERPFDLNGEYPLRQQDDHLTTKRRPIVEFEPQEPYIFDPGNGPRVRDTRVFLTSFFAQPPCQDDSLSAEFAQEEVLQMLCTILPEETALILWYNKSRATGRICPACKRLYRLGDVLPDHLTDEHTRTETRPSPRLESEQEISGLCSPVCFILASFNYPGAIKSAWGNTAEEMGDEAWALLNSPGEAPPSSDSVSQPQKDNGLGMLVRMTRLHDLGMGQLCLPDVDFEEMDARVEEEQQYDSTENGEEDAHEVDVGKWDSRDRQHEPGEELRTCGS